MSTNRPIRLLLVDDHTLFRRGLKALLSLDGRLEVAGEAGDLGEALAACRRSNPTWYYWTTTCPECAAWTGSGRSRTPCQACGC